MRLANSTSRNRTAIQKPVEFAAHFMHVFHTVTELKIADDLWFGTDQVSLEYVILYLFMSYIHL